MRMIKRLARRWAAIERLHARRMAWLIRTHPDRWAAFHLIQLRGVGL